MQITTPTIILALLSAKGLVLGNIIPDNSQQFKLEGYCWDKSLTAHTHYPTEDDHNLGAREICDIFYGTEKTRDLNMYDQSIAHVTLPAFDKKGTIEWVYEMAVEDSSIKQPVTYDRCVRGFKDVLAEGKLGDNYCVVQGTEIVLSKGGKREQPLQYGTLRFEVRKKRGT